MLLEIISYIFALAPFIGLVYLVWQYILYFKNVAKEPPKDKPNARVWVIRGAILIPFIIGFKVVFLPFLFVIKPQWMLDLSYILLFIGWVGFVAMIIVTLYKKYVSPTPLSPRDYKEILQTLRLLGKDETISIYRYVWEVFLSKIRDRYIEFVESLFFSKYKPMFAVWDANVAGIDQNIRILSKIRVKNNKEVFYDKPYTITVKDATKHIHILAPTGSGKTKSVLSPLMEQAIDKGIGIVSIDPKGDTEVMNSILGMFQDQGRIEDLKFFDLAFPERSHTYNPLATNTPIVCQSIINATLPEPKGGEFYVGKQQEFINAIMSWMDTFYKIMGTEGKKFNFIDLYTIIAYLPDSIDLLLSKVDSAKNRDKLSQAWIKGIKQEAEDDKRYTSFLAGLRKHISRYAFLSNATWLINDYNPDIDVKKDLDEGRAITFFLRALKYPAGESLDIGKMLLMDIQAYASRNQEKGVNKKIPNFVFVDEAASIIPRQFMRMFEMARSSGIGIIVAHQDMSQFEKDIFSNIFNNSSTRVLLRAGDIDTAKFFSDLSGQKREYQYTFGTSGYNIFDSLKEWFLPHWTSMAKESLVPAFRPDELLNISLGEGYVVSSTAKGNVVIMGKTYFFAKEYDSISIENLFPINKERLKKWKEGGLNLIDEMDEYEMEKRKLSNAEKKKVSEFKRAQNITESDFTQGQIVAVQDIASPSGYMSETEDDMEISMVAADGDVSDIDVAKDQNFIDD